MDSEKKNKKTEKDKNQHIQVVLRARPINAFEKKQGALGLLTVIPERKEVIVKEKPNSCATKTFTFDKVYGPNSKQADVYKEVVVPILDEVLLGYNCTIFAYGQTGTGKTFTMEGERSSDASFSWEDDPLSGIIPRTLHHLFDTLSQQQADFTVRVSFVELYNEELFDLLTGVEDSQRLRLYEDPVRKGSVVIHGLEEMIVRTKDEVYVILEQGAKKRQTAATLLNAQSSRSHSVFSITVHIRETTLDGEELLKTGKLYLVDLAGSENIGRSGAVEKRAREAGNINQSLLTLGRVITALVEHAPHVPYRESKLTRLLQDSLGGRTKTSIIATVSPASTGIDETLSTLDYAFRAKNITNRPEINQKLTKKAIMKEYAEEIERLRRDLQATREKCGIYIAEENYNLMQAKMSQQEDAITELTEKIGMLEEDRDKINELFDHSRKRLEETAAELEITTNKYLKTRSALNETAQTLHKVSAEKDEQKFLLDVHVGKEKQLYSQAEQVADIGRRAAANLNFLHGKLERKDALEQKNFTTVQQFRNFVVAQIETLDRNLHKFLEEQNKCLKDHQTNLVHQLNDSKSKLGDLTLKLNETQEKSDANLSSIHSMFDGQISKRLESLNLNENQICSILNVVSEEINQFHSTVLKTHIAACQENISAITTELVAWKSYSEQRNTAASSLVDTVCSAFRNDVDNFVSMLNEKRADQTSAVESIDKSMLYIDETHHKMNADIKRAMKLLHSVAEQQQKLCNENFPKIANEIKRYRASDETISTEIKGFYEKSLSNLNDSKHSLEQQFKVVFSDAAKHNEKISTTIEKTSKICEKLSNDDGHFIDEFNKDMKRYRVEVAKIHSSEKDVENDFKTAAMNIISEIKSQNVQNSKRLVDPTVQLEGELVNFTSNGCKQMDECAKACRAWAGGQASIFSSLSSNADRFLSEKIARYKPTGETPTRQHFNIPTDFVKTSPHETLIKRYRQENPIPPFLGITDEDKENETVD